MKAVIIVFITIFIVACSDSETPQKVEQDHVWKQQTDMIDKAKGVEQTLQDAAELQRQSIEQQTQ